MIVWNCKCNATELGTAGCKRHSSAQAGQSGAQKGKESGGRLGSATPKQTIASHGRRLATKRNTATRQGEEAKNRSRQTQQHPECNNKPTPAQELAKAARRADKQPSQEGTATQRKVAEQKKQTRLAQQRPKCNNKARPGTEAGKSGQTGRHTAATRDQGS